MISACVHHIIVTFWQQQDTEKTTASSEEEFSPEFEFLLQISLHLNL
jgi:hypothetical protein